MINENENSTGENTASTTETQQTRPQLVRQNSTAVNIVEKMLKSAEAAGDSKMVEIYKQMLDKHLTQKAQGQESKNPPTLEALKRKEAVFRKTIDSFKGSPSSGALAVYNKLLNDNLEAQKRFTEPPQIAVTPAVTNDEGSPTRPGIKSSLSENDLSLLKVETPTVALTSFEKPNIIVLIEDNDMLLKTHKKMMETKCFGQVEVKGARSATEGVANFIETYDAFVANPENFGKVNIVFVSDNDLNDQPTPKSDRTGIDALPKNHGIAAMNEVTEHMAEKEKELGLDEASINALKDRKANGETLTESEMQRMKYTRPKEVLNTNDLKTGTPDAHPLVVEAIKDGLKKTGKEADNAPQDRDSLVAQAIKAAKEKAGKNADKVPETIDSLVVDAITAGANMVWPKKNPGPACDALKNLGYMGEFIQKPKLDKSNSTGNVPKVAKTNRGYTPG